VTGLREMLEEEAATPAPPIGRATDELYAVGRRRYRRRAVVKGGAACLAITAAVVAMIGVIGPGSHAAKLPAGHGVPSAAGDPRPGVTSPLDIIQWAGAADADHLYLVYLAFFACAPSSCDKGPFDLVGSDDGGHTWTQRARIQALRWFVLGPRTLAAVTQPAGAKVSSLTVSTDGGRTWAAATRDSAAVPAVPSGSTVICWSADETSSSCDLYAVDPASRRFAPLAGRPALIPNWANPVQSGSGRLWVSGTEPASGRPAAAVSTDGGHTWSTHVFTDVTGCTSSPCDSLALSTTDGGTAYAVIHRASQRLVYRGTDKGDWKRVDAAAADPNQWPGRGGQSFVTADGTHVLCEAALARDNGACQFWAVGNAATAYRQVKLDGLPSTVYPIRRTPDGWFYTYSMGDNILYGSTDGWHWSPVTSG
jgi:hypothetical protein